MRLEAFTKISATTMLNEHIRAVKLLQGQLERLASLRSRGKVSEVLYNHILDEVRTRIELFGMERDALMVLLDEYLKLLESSEAESFLTKTNLEETFEVPEEQETSPFWLDATIMVNEGGRDIDIGRDNCKICSSCGVKNPAEANFCISCATKLPSISKIDEI